MFLYFDLLYWYFFYGHDFNDYCTFEFWNKNYHERKSYISLRRNNILRVEFSSPETYAVFLNKAEFNLHFKRFIHRQWIVTGDKTFEEIEAFIGKYKSVIIKPLEDYGGHGVVKIDGMVDKSSLRLLNVDWNDVVGGKYIIEECIENCEALRELAPGSLNTIRIVTVIDREHTLHFVAALLRMGNGTAITDNYHDGGMACAIDIKKGCLKGNAYGMNCVKYECHPYSHVKFDGFLIPGFRKCLQLVENAAYCMPDARYVGWDLAITSSGIELLEGNIPPGEDITQIATGRGMWYQMQKWK